MDSNKNNLLGVFVGQGNNFKEIEKLVNTFEGADQELEKVFINQREQTLKEQLVFIKSQKDILRKQIGKYLMKAESEIQAWSETENYINRELDKCREMKSVINEVKE